MADQRCEMAIDPTARVHPQARIGRHVVIGAYADIGPEVVVGDGSQICTGVTMAGAVRIGKGNFVGPGVCLGIAPRGASSSSPPGAPVLIGNGNSIREFTCISAGQPEGNPTVVGNDNLLMACCHLGAGCRLGNRLVLANGSCVGDRVDIADGVIISGLVRIEDGVHIGRLAMVGGVSHLDRDVPPFTVVTGHPAVPRCLNHTGLRRQGLIALEEGRPFRDLKYVWRRVCRGQPQDARERALAERPGRSVLAAEFLDFILACRASLAPSGPEPHHPPP
jgi:UDP-N-acetylglucosamine acyltransferase